MIEKGYLCDYTLNVPIFSEDPTDTNICEYLIQRHRNIIIYCDTQEKGKHINTIMNNLLHNCSKYIDCTTSKTQRNQTINDFKSGKLQFLVNVRILTEGFDAPITKGVCFLHLPKSGTMIIQIIGRSLRLHPEKKYASVILPCSNSEDEKSISNFLKVISKNDSRIKKSYDSKNTNGYINIINAQQNTSNNNINEIELRYEMIYNSLGSLENAEEIWKYKFDEVETFINNNHKRPNSCSVNVTEAKLGTWICTQQTNYRKKLNIMKNEFYYNIWNAFLKRHKILFQSATEKWFQTFENIKIFTKTFDKLPSSSAKNNEEKSLGVWICNQKQNYKEKTDIMKNDHIYITWTIFLNENSKYFVTSEDIWLTHFENLEKYIKTYGKFPCSRDKNEEIAKLAKWLFMQNRNYKLKICTMSFDYIYDKWTDFINQHPDLFLSPQEKWFINLHKIESYININKKLPTKISKIEEERYLGEWLAGQRKTFVTKTQIMKYAEIHDAFALFLDKYKDFFITNEERWYEILNEVKEFYNKYTNLPKHRATDPHERHLRTWINTQDKNFKSKSQIMKNVNIQNEWFSFCAEYKILQ
jgi:hypothetical protein